MFLNKDKVPSLGTIVKTWEQNETNPAVDKVTALNVFEQTSRSKRKAGRLI